MAFWTQFTFRVWTARFCFSLGDRDSSNSGKYRKQLRTLKQPHRVRPKTLVPWHSVSSSGHKGLSREEYKNRTSINDISPNIHPGSTYFQLRGFLNQTWFLRVQLTFTEFLLHELAQCPLRLIQDFSIHHSFGKINYPLHEVHIFLFVLNLAPSASIWFPLALGQDAVKRMWTTEPYLHSLWFYRLLSSSPSVLSFPDWKILIYLIIPNKDTLPRFAYLFRPSMEPLSVLLEPFGDWGACGVSKNLSLSRAVRSWIAT